MIRGRFGIWQVVLLLGGIAVIAVQAFQEYDDPIDTIDLATIQPIISALSLFSPFSPMNRRKNLVLMQTILSPSDFQTVMDSVLGMDKALETIKPAFPALKNSLLTLTDALPAFASIRSKYRKAVPNGDGPIPKGIYKRIVHLMPVLDEALEQLTPAFPILAETLIMLSRELSKLSPAMPALYQYISAHNAGVRSVMDFSLPAYGKACDSIEDSLSKFKEYALPYLVSFLSAIIRANTPFSGDGTLMGNPYYGMQFSECQRPPYGNVPV